MRAWMLAFCGGVVMAGWMPQLPARSVLAAGLLLALLLQLLHLLHWCRHWPCRLPGAFLAGMCYLLFWGHWQLSAWLPAHAPQQDMLAQATVVDLPVRIERGWRVRLRLQASCQVDASDCRALAWWQARLVQVSVYDDSLSLAPGQRWQWLLRLRRPHGFANPGGFDYQAWLLQQGIVATGYLRSSTHNRLLSEASGGPWFPRLRHAMRARLRADERPPLLHGALVEALSLGLREGITEQQWQHFSQLGLNHLVVISGLHLGLVTAVLFGLAHRLARCSRALLLHWPAPRIAAALALLGACAYAGLAGFTLPVQRALVMALVVCSGTLLGRQTSARQSLQLALLLVLLLDPLAPQSAGFWLSFLAVAILLRHAPAAAPPDDAGAGQQAPVLPPFAQYLWQTIRLQLLLGVGMLPVMLVFFQQTSALAPLANLLAIPWIGLLVVPCCLLGLLLLPWSSTLAAPVLQMADFLLDCFLRGVAAVSSWWPHGLLTLPPLGPGVLSLCLLLAALALLGPRWYWRAAALVLLPGLLLWPARRLAPGVLELTVLDTGQGLAVLVDTRSQRLLYDAGPRYSERFDAGADLLLPVMRRLGLAGLDMVIISHADLDHAGGLPAVMAQFPQAHYLSSEPAVLGPVPSRELCRPRRWQRDGYHFALLHPDAGDYDDNDGSCVLHIRGAAGSILLPGDISRRVEARLLQRYPRLQADLVVAPHHGSKSSSSTAFIRRLQPRWVVYSSGYLNRFGHPAELVQARYQRAGAEAFNTAVDGAIRLRLDAQAGQPPQPTAQRRQYPRFWHGTREPDAAETR